MQRRNFLTTMAATAAAMALPGKSAATMVTGFDPGAPEGDWSPTAMPADMRRHYLHPLNFLEALAKEPEGGVLHSSFCEPVTMMRRTVMHTAFGRNVVTRREAMEDAYWYGVDEDLVEELDQSRAHQLTYGRHVHPVYPIGEGTQMYWISGLHYSEARFELPSGRTLAFVMGEIPSPANPTRMMPRHMPGDDGRVMLDCQYWWHITGRFVEKYLRDGGLWNSEGHVMTEI